MADGKPGPDLEPTAAALNSGAIHLLRSLAAVDRLAGLTPARLSALSVVVFAGPQSLGELAAAEGVAGPTMTRIVDGLAAAGLVERKPDLRDRRSVTIAPTPAGERLMRTAARRRISVIAAAISTLPAADRRRIVAAAGLLDHLADVVRRTQLPRASDPAAERPAR